MFTGIIEEVGLVRSIRRGRDSAFLHIEGKKVLENTVLGDSIAINGVCQTVTRMDKNSFTVDVLKESLLKTNLGKLTVGNRVNLERALTLTRPLGGHIVQGHVQGVGKVLHLSREGLNRFLKVELSKELMRYMVNEGSVAIDGLSLTIAEAKRDTIRINIIPHTVEETTIADLKVGDSVNIEPDILLKSVFEKRVEGLTAEKLLSWGY